MSVRLLDVNLPVSLLDSEHVDHKVAIAWFRGTAAKDGWATCPVTENGFVRIVSQVSYPNLRLTPATQRSRWRNLKRDLRASTGFGPTTSVLRKPNCLFS